MNQFNTFLDIISEQGIEIPPIQRDYAQGRTSKRIETIRTKFISSIFFALKNNTPLRLDFIYGKIYGIRNEEEHKRNKLAIDSLLSSVKEYANSVDLTFSEFEIKDKSPYKEDLIYLVPLDGQQRLTALFLIHWYLSRKMGSDENLDVLKRFKYKTRKSSLSFIYLICSDITIDFTKEIDDQIKNLENFSNTWLDDPTVNSLIEVLKTIHGFFKNESDEDIAVLWQRLVTSKIVFFDFLNLKDFNLSDELYVKMNARGKQLSDFENFKAWLFREIEIKIESGDFFKAELLKQYENKFDVQWNDIFWNSKGSNDFEIDEVYFNYFKLVFVYDLLKNIKLRGTNFEEGDDLNCIDVIMKNGLIDFEKEFDDLFFKNIPDYFKILEICADFNVNDPVLSEFYKFFFSKSGIAPSWIRLVKNYILLSYLIVKDKKLIDYTEQEHWVLQDYYRIMNNLFVNATIDNQSLYKNAISEIDEMTSFLLKNNFNISIWIEDLEYHPKSVFQKHQIEEEILKYRLLSNREQWQSVILEAEAIPYFEGQLNFWFYKCDITLEKAEFKEDYLEDSYLEIFKDTSYKIQKLFDKKGLRREGDFSERIFERALLSKTDYLLNEGGYKCFGRDTGRDVSWKRLFLRDRNKENANGALKEIFDLDFNDVKTSFQQYIESNKEDYNHENWRKVFVENKKLFNYLGNLKYIRKIENHGWIIVNGAYKTYIGAHYELFSLNFFSKHLNNKINDFAPFDESSYHLEGKNSFDKLPCAYLNWKVKDYALDIRYIDDEYNLFFFSRSSAVISTAIKTILVEQGFTNLMHGFMFKVKDESETVTFIKGLAKKFEQEILAEIL